MPAKPNNSTTLSQTLLGGLTVSDFLAQNWQKRALFVRGAWPDFAPPLSANELAGLACEDGSTARIVLEHGDGPWELRHGPFDEEAFTALPPTHWTLLVSDVEKWRPELCGILEPFRFIPDWRIDDLMVSYAAPQGSVGPHVDQYDVFLLQAKGHRRWQISSQSVAPDNRIGGIELDIIADFEPEHEWTAAPGDLLYLPPGVAHFGVALDECMTFSVGFRAPSQRDLVLGLLDSIAISPDCDARYSDPDLTLSPSPGWIAEDAIDRVEAMLREALRIDRDTIRRWFGRFITEPKSDLIDLLDPNAGRSLEELRAALERHGYINRSSAARLSMASMTDRLLLFVNGEEFDLPCGLGDAAEMLCTHYRITGAELDTWLDDDAFSVIVLSLYRSGILYFTDE